MIDEVRTFKRFKYFSTDLTHGSRRNVYAVCNDCRTGRWIEFRQYKSLCRSCIRSGERNCNFGRTFSKETIQKMRIANLGKRASEETCKKLRRNVPSGKNSPHWNPNLTNEERIQKRDYGKYKDWRKSVYERDNFTCQVCGNNTSNNFNAHHLDSYSSNPNKRTLLKNGITLCKECHNDFHHKYGYGNNTKEQFLKFINGY